MITREDIEKAFSNLVEYSPAPWRRDKLSRPPTLSEVEERIMALFDADEKARPAE